MREIKFRVWCKDSKTMEYFRPTSHFNIKLNGDLFFDDEIIDDSRVFLLQYTGLKDKNCKEIYEGDIITFIDNRLLIVKVRTDKIEWSEEGACFFPMLYYCSDIEVIGNIYENPELIEESKK